MTHVPLRTCVGCRRSGPKDELVRLVRTSQDTVAVDRSGAAPGRGCYLHPHPDCVAVAMRKGAVARALRVRPAAEELVRLRNEIERMGAR